MGIGQLVKKVTTRFNKGGGGGSKFKNAVGKIGGIVAKLVSWGKIGGAALKKGGTLVKKGLQFANDHKDDAIRIANTAKTGLQHLANATGNQKLQNLANKTGSVIDKGQNVATKVLDRSNKVMGAVNDVGNSFKQLRAKR